MFYYAEQEYTRQGAITKEKSDKTPLFRISDLNRKFEVCRTYPEFLIVPYMIADREIQECSTFRTKNRFPVLSYYYRQSGGCIWRSSQPKSGITNIRNHSDEKYLKYIGELADRLFVYDARPKMAALGNRVSVLL